MIKVWQFSEAPTFLKNMSTNGGDEDWVIAVPVKDRSKAHTRETVMDDLDIMTMSFIQRNANHFDDAENFYEGISYVGSEKYHIFIIAHA